MFIGSPYCYYYFAIESGLRVFIRVSGIHGFGFGDRLPPESVFGAVSGLDFGFRVRVHRDFTRSESVSLPSLSQAPKATQKTNQPKPTSNGPPYLVTPKNQKKFKFLITSNLTIYTWTLNINRKIINYFLSIINALYVCCKI